MPRPFWVVLWDPFWIRSGIRSGVRSGSDPPARRKTRAPWGVPMSVAARDKVVVCAGAQNGAVCPCVERTASADLRAPGIDGHMDDPRTDVPPARRCRNDSGVPLHANLDR